MAIWPSSRRDTVLSATPSFSVTLDGMAYAQPLFLDGQFGGADGVLVATENNVCELRRKLRQSSAAVAKAERIRGVSLDRDPCVHASQDGRGIQDVDLPRPCSRSACMGGRHHHLVIARPVQFPM